MPTAPAPAVRFFATPAAFRAWLGKHHESATELHVGFHRKDTGLGGMTYAEAVDEALCFGWIDGVMRKVNATSYCHRFTPRKPGSIWSLTNVGHVQRLQAAGRMHPSGLRAFAARTPERTGVYAFEQKQAVRLPAAAEKRFRAHAAAWKFFQAQAPWYRRLITFKIASAKKEETRERWLQKAIDASAAGKRIDKA